MSDRKQVNKYYPPDFDWKKHGTLNSYRKSHPLRARAAKLGEGIMTIRFEMPYNIWCSGCGNHIGMGVRYNAQKKKVGSYYSTTIFQFRFKCYLCPNFIEMKTDPQNLDYAIVSGARRQERRWDALANEQIQAEEKKEHHRMESDSMFKLERNVVDEGKKMALVPTMERLVQIQDTLWDDDFSQNKRLRDYLRAEKKKDKNIQDEKEAIQTKYSLDIPVADKSEKDDYLAKLILENAPSKNKGATSKDLRNSILKRNILPVARNHLSKNSKLLLHKLKKASVSKNSSLIKI